MKKLDSICSKLMHQSAIGFVGVDSQSGVGTNGDQHLSTADDTSNKSERASPSPRLNKRKNFTPKVFRQCDDQLSDEIGKESGNSVLESISLLNDGGANGKRLRLSIPCEDSRSGSSDGDSSGHIQNEFCHQNGGHSHEYGESVQTPGILAVVEPDENNGTPSGRSSSNHSNSLFGNAGTTSSSVSPSLLLGTISTFNNIAQCQSPISALSALSAPSLRYAQHRAGDDDVKPASDQSQPGSSVTSSKKDEQPTSPVVSYLVRFLGNDCGAEQCRFATSREHFHCKLCNNKLFTKKEEMLRHYKWHRKREESLAFGFMRYSASDDCSQNFTDCVHNLRQTHYHCLQDSCDKVYISTSDVQMHANSHRKQAHIAKEGFQRVKGSEHCTYSGCPFTDPTNRTTHFHCLRPGCTHSFKNKADMDKHKAHHTRDEQLTRDGFKKYMKSEACPFAGCAFSRIVNHIHCIRPGCDYVLHSTSQMYSHKRKHEKQDKRVSDYVAQQQAIANAFQNAAAFITAAGASANFSLSSSARSPTSPKTPTSHNHCDASIFPSAPTSINGVAAGSTNFVDRNDQSFSTSAKKAVAAAIQGRLKLKQYDPHARTFHDAGSLGSNGNKPLDYRGEKTPTSANPNLDRKVELIDLDDVAAMGIDMCTLQSPIHFLKSVTKAAAEGDAEMKHAPILHSETAVKSMVSELNYTQAKQQQLPNMNGRNKGDDSWKKFITRYTANDPCVSLCPLLYKDHYHCTAGEGCKTTFKSKDGVRDHAKQHEQLCQAIEYFRTYEADEDCKARGCPYARHELHYHCSWDNCSESIGSSEPVFRRLEHHKVHEYSSQLVNDSRSQGLLAQNVSSSSSVSRAPNVESPKSASPSQTPTTALGEVIKRKRGRPPKYNVLDVNVNPSSHIGQSPEILLTSFKLAKGATGVSNAATPGQGYAVQPGQSDQQQSASPSQSRRGRPRTVSSPRHASEDASATATNQAAAVALLQQRQAHQLQQQLELLRMWNSSMDTAAAAATPSPVVSEVRSDQSISAKRPQFDGFTTYMAMENCPDSLCRYRGQLHYHCRLPRCFYSSSSGKQLESHHRDFHNALEIPDGYACYDRSYNCRHTSCQYNGQARHFHCQKAGCSAALLKFNELTDHTSEGHAALQHDQQFGSPAQNPKSSELDIGAGMVRNNKAGSNHVVRTSGIFFPAPMGFQTPMSAIGGSLPPAPFPSSIPAASSTLTLNPASLAALAQSISPFAFMNAALGTGATSPITGFGPVGPNGIGVTVPNNPLPYTVEQQCGRPFCKLKRRMHYHCTLCHQGFSHFDRLTVHMQKHGIALPPLLSQQSPISSAASMQPKPVVQAQSVDPHRSIANSKSHPKPGEKKSDPTAPHPESRTVTSPSSATGTGSGQKKVKFHVFQPKIMKFSDSEIQANIKTEAAEMPPHRDVKTAKRSKKAPSYGSTAMDTISAAVSNVIAGTTQFKFVDCTADVVHSLERQMDIRNSAQLSPGNSTPRGTSPAVSSELPSATNSYSSGRRILACLDEGCSKNSVASTHYHCGKCEFWTPESTKWHMHVKQHARMDQVAALGFRKVVVGGSGEVPNGTDPNSTPCPVSSDCSIADQSHYHCMTCNVVALNQSQMSAHKTTKHPDAD